MKSFTGFNPKQFYIVVFLSAIIILSSQCNDTGKSPTTADSTATAEPNIVDAAAAPADTKSFEQSPPIAQRMLVKKLQEPDSRGNTMVVMAEFSETERKAKNLTQFSLKLNDNEEVVFADNGREGDEKKDDGIFSGLIKVKDEEFRNLVNRNNEINAKKQNTEAFFLSRSAQARKVSNIELADFLAGKPILINFALFSIVDAVTLPAIRDKSLMITDLSVVEDLTRTYDPCRNNKGNANGAWSFKTLVTNMAGPIPVKQFVVDWVDNFLFSTHNLPSGDITTNRLQSKERLIKAWMQNSGLAVPAAPGIPAGWQGMNLKVEEFPVRLMTIVNRLDLRGNSGYGGFSNAGEGRLVFCFVDSRANCFNGNNGPGTMTFIFEYGIPLTGCLPLKDYATKWWNLRTTPFGNAFNAALQGITSVFTAANAKPSKPNGSALNHLRTNDFLRQNVNVSTDPWDIRDFEIDAVTHRLKIIHPNKEAMESSNGFGTVAINVPKLASLVAFVNTIPFISDPNPVYKIPLAVQAIHAPMRVPPGARYHWKGNPANIMIPLNRREFSLNTCSGCHKGETNNPFTHVRPRNVGTKSTLSGFMTGLGADDNGADNDADPAGKFFVTDQGIPALAQKEFNEAQRRAIDLEKLVFNSPCFIFTGFPQNIIAIHQILNFRPLNMEH